MQISFYVLSDSKAQDFLGFICQLTQTALNKSSQPLLVLIDDEALLSALDEALWAHDASSFIPHQHLVINTDNKITESSLAPVLLAAHLPEGFSGIVINTTAHPVNHFMAKTNNALPTRVLEIIQPDSKSMQQGRDKYKHYQQLNYELTHFKV
jgi:DNA polymerase-3 subunit chi